MGVMSLYRGTDTTWCFMVKLAVLQRVVSRCLYVGYILCKSTINKTTELLLYIWVVSAPKS